MGLDSGRAEVVGDEESLQRAVISKSQIARTTRRIKPQMMCPNPHVELSVSRIDNLGETEIQVLAHEVAKKRGKEKSLGYAKLKAAAPRKHGLDVAPDEPPLHHANIKGWPADSDPDEQRRRQLQAAKLLVEDANLILWDDDQSGAKSI